MPVVKVNPIYWLASYPKSGNTFLRFLTAAYAFGVLDINANMGCTLFDGDIYTYNSLSPRPLCEMTSEQVVYLRHAALLHLMTARRHGPTLMKTHCADMMVGDVPLIPQHLTAGAVYLVRDPRDVAVSFARHTGKSVDAIIDDMANPANKNETVGINIAQWTHTWSHHVRSWMERDDTLTVKYEDLKTNTVPVFEKILQALRIEVDPAKLKKAVKLTALDRLQKQEAKHGFIEKGRQAQFFGAGRGWQHELTDHQAQRIERDHKDMMLQLEYI